MSSGDSKTALPLDRLQDYLSAQLGSSVSNLTATEFSGGASNPTYRLESSLGKFVLRGKPVGKLVSNAHAIDREYRVINALGSTDFPVPKTVLYCDDVSVTGAEFYIMECVEGRVEEDFTLPGASKAERAAIYDSLNETIAQLHRIDPDAIGLSDYGKPGNYFERQIKLWMRQYEQQSQTTPEFEDLASWLTENLITDEQRTIVHGDFTLANVMLAPDQPKVAAVLDWELSTLGHPLADLTYHLSQWYLPNYNKDLGRVTLADSNLDDLGVPAMEIYAKRYFDRVAYEISPKDLYYGIAFNMYRLSGIIIGIIERTRSGTAKNEFARSVGHTLQPTLDTAWRFVKKAEGEKS